MFFPEEVREDVIKLYAYVRIADNFVDGSVPDKEGFEAFTEETKRAFIHGTSQQEIIDSFVKLAQQKQFNKKWIDAFLYSMHQDLSVNTYETYRDLHVYMYGSAEVIGLMMARILGLPKAANRFAKYQGEAFQLINFIRDVGDDLARNRVYLPQEDLRKFGLQTLPPTSQSLAQFEELIQYEVKRFFLLQQKAEGGYSYIPKKYRIPIKTAADMFIWTAKEIQKNPLIVLSKQVKPSPERVKIQYLKNIGDLV